MLFNGFGFSNRCTYVFPTDTGLYFRCGCFAGNEKEFKEQIKNTYDKKNKHYKEYMTIIELANINVGE